MSSTTTPEWLSRVASVQQAAEMLGLGELRVRQMIREGKLVAEKLGRDYVVDRQSVEAERARRSR